MEPSMQARLHEEDLQRLRGFRLLDDDFMTVVFDSNIQATTLLLNILFDRSDMIVQEVVAQREIKNANGRSIRLDILATDSTGKVYDIEVQRADQGAIAQRARFNSSMMDTKLLQPGDDVSQIVDAYVIFITEHDVLGMGHPLYHIERTIQETGALFRDGSHILYVNGAYRNESDPIGKLMHDFRCTQADDMHYAPLADRVRYFKESEGGQTQMCKAMEDMRNATVQARNIEFARKMLARGKDTIEEIAEICDLSVDFIKTLAAT